MLDAFVKDGLLWVNGPDSSKAVVVDNTGGHKPIQKYSPDVPGGPDNPLPKAGAPNGNRGNPSPGRHGPGDTVRRRRESRRRTSPPRRRSFRRRPR